MTTTDAPPSKLRSVAREVARLGPWNAALWTLGRLLSVLTDNRARIHRYRFVAQPVRKDPLARVGLSSIAIRRIDAHDPLVQQFPRPAGVIAERFRMGALCVGAEKQGKFVGFLWLKEREYPEDEVRCLYRLEPPGVAVWDFDVYVEPEYRGGRTFARLWDAANAWLFDHGYGWSLSRISAFNPESLAAHARLGTRALCSATFVRLGTLQLALLPQAPFLHASFRDDRTPMLRLRPPNANPPR
jgi:GNAT superfamily N-acetyltransferase